MHGLNEGAKLDHRLWRNSFYCLETRKYCSRTKDALIEHLAPTMRLVLSRVAPNLVPCWVRTGFQRFVFVYLSVCLSVCLCVTELNCTWNDARSTDRDEPGAKWKMKIRRRCSCRLRLKSSTVCRRISMWVCLANMRVLVTSPSLFFNIQLPLPVKGFPNSSKA